MMWPKGAIPLFLTSALFILDSVNADSQPANVTGEDSEQNDIFLCRRCTTVTLTSSGVDRYVAHSIPEAAQITAVRILQEQSAGLCRPQVSYDSYGSVLWVDHGCNAQFEVCFTKGSIRTIRCGQRIPARITRCNIPSDCRAISLALKDVTPKTCRMGTFSYTYSNFFGRRIYVSAGCQAQFIVGCRQCLFNRDG